MQYQACPNAESMHAAHKSEIYRIQHRYSGAGKQNTVEMCHTLLGTYQACTNATEIQHIHRYIHRYNTNTTQNTVEMCHTLLGTQSVKLRPFPPSGFISIAPGRALEVKIYNVDIFFEV